MKKETIAEILKQNRKESNLSVKDVSDIFQNEYGIKVAEKTIYGWESAQNQPDADRLLQLCKIYNVDNVLNTFGLSDEPEELSLTAFEKEMIKKYRSEPDIQEAVKRLLKMS